jgi:predicted nucleotidyltransferase
MRKSASPLMAIFRTPLQGQLLAEVYLRPAQQPQSISDLARVLDEPVATVQREVARLIDAGLLTERKIGRTRAISRPEGNAAVAPLTQLLELSFGPLPVLGYLLAEVEGIQEAYLYGSWAARYRGESGPVPRDIDVLVVGDPDIDVLDEIAESAEQQLRREVNIRKVSPARWKESAGDPFLTEVRRRPLVTVARPGSDPDNSHSD